MAVFFFIYDRGGSAGVGDKYRSVSRLGLLIGNRWMPGLVVLECANCSLHEMVEGALSETAATVSLSTVPRLAAACCCPVCEWGSGRVGDSGRYCHRLISRCVHVHTEIK